MSLHQLNSALSCRQRIGQQMTHTCANRSAKCGSALKARIGIMDGRVTPQGTLPDWRRAKKLQWLVIPTDAGSPNFNRIKTLWVPAFAGMTWKKFGKPCGMQAKRLCLCLQKETPRRRAGAFELLSFGRVRRRLRFRRS